jgi:NSS family neurotransmitter:Na+ symporter
MIFFFLFSVAALTSTVSLLEVVSAYCIDERGWSRARTVWTTAAATFVIGVPSALAWAGAEPWATVNLIGFDGFFSVVSFLFVDVSLPLGAVLLCLFGAHVWGLDRAAAEILSSSSGFTRIEPAWRFFVRWLCPLLITIILAVQFVNKYAPGFWDLLG